MLKFPPPDPTIGEVADLEEREGRGESLTPVETEVLAEARAAFRAIHTRMAPGLSLVQRTAKSVSESIGATLNHWAEQYCDEFAWVDALSARKRARYAHMTMPEVRRAMRREAATAPLTRPARRDSHGMRPGHRRAAARAAGVRSGSDPGEPEPASSRVAVGA